MSDNKKEEKKDNKESKEEPKNAHEKAKEELEDEDEGYTCGKCCRGYEACIVWTCRCIYRTIVGIKNCIVFTMASVWYPIKERCCNCCDSCHKKNNPYKDPYYVPYDTL